MTKINKPLSKKFHVLLLNFMDTAESIDEKKILVLMAKEVWNISYFNEKDQETEIENFVKSLETNEFTAKKYKKMMIQGITDKKIATKNIDLKGVWVRVKNLKVWKKNDFYKSEFEFDFFE